MNIGQILFDPSLLGKNETPEMAQARVKKNSATVKAALGTAQGKKLLQLLTSASPPYAPRFTGDCDPVKAALADGEKNLIGLLVIHGGNPNL